MSIIYRALRRSQRKELQEQDEAPERGAASSQAETRLRLRDRVRMGLERTRFRIGQWGRGVGAWFGERSRGQLLAFGGLGAFLVAGVVGAALWLLLVPDTDPEPDDPMADVAEEVEVDEEVDEDVEEIDPDAIDEVDLAELREDEELVFPRALPEIPGSMDEAVARRDEFPTLDELAREMREAGELMARPEVGTDGDVAEIDPGQALPRIDTDVDKAPDPAETVPEPRARPDAAADASRVVRVSRLSREINRAMQQGDAETVEAKLDELSEVRGEGDRFVLKMRAYHAMRQDRLEEAESYLLAVLDQERYDLEAGINLAIVEARLGRIDDARSRAHRLRERYPDEHRVHTLLSRLGR